MKITNKGQAFIFKIYAFLVFLIPMSVLFAANYGEYKSDGAVIGFWGIILIAFVVLAFKDFVINFFKKQPLTTISLAIFIISMITSKLSGQLQLISGVALAASVLSSFVSVISDSFMNHAYIVMPNGEKTLNTAPAITVRQAAMEAYGFVFADKKNDDKQE